MQQTPLKQKTMFSYYAYGLNIQSELYIPEFIQIETNSAKEYDVSIYIDRESEPENHLPSSIDEPWYVNIGLENAVFFLKELGLIQIQNGNRIKIITAPEVADEFIRAYLVGSIMAILLYQRKFLVLHGSAVEINHSAVIFLGASGAGKSSTLAALYANGHQMIADDVAAVSLNTKPFTVLPSFPQIKLSLETCSSLGYNFESLHRLAASETKRGYQSIQNFPRSPLAIQHIYILAFDKEFGIERLKPQEAAIELIRHSRPTTLLQTGGMLHFLQCTYLAKEFPIYYLKRPRNLELLPEFARFIETHATQGVQSLID